MNEQKLQEILIRMGYPTPVSIHQFRSEEDGAAYGAWHVMYPEQTLVLKEAKECELEIYQTFFREHTAYAPQLMATASFEERDYLLMEFIPGDDLRNCTREKLTHALDSLIAMQSAHWHYKQLGDWGWSYARSLPGRQNRRNYLKDAVLETVYDAFLSAYTTLPRTLCHDDLLPFNVLHTGDRAVFIDWEVGGILPYPVSLARLIAHGEEDPQAFFYMTEEDRRFALDYYFDHFIQNKGISRETYDQTMDLFLFYECCEWVYLGNKYEDADMERFRIYEKKAKSLAEKILKNHID